MKASQVELATDVAQLVKALTCRSEVAFGCGCETWTLILRAEQRLRVFENKVHRKIYGAKRDEVTGEWRKLHNAELHALYSSPDIIRNIKSRRLRWAGHVARIVTRDNGVMLVTHPGYRFQRSDIRTITQVILPVVLYGCETWTLTLREEQRLRVFENKVLRKIFGAKRDEVTGEWRKLHNAELHALHPSPDIIRNIKSRRLRWAGHVARMGESRNAYRVLVGRPEEKRPLGRPRRRWKDNIKMDLREEIVADVVPGFAYRCHLSRGAAQIPGSRRTSVVDYGRTEGVAPSDRWHLRECGIYSVTIKGCSRMQARELRKNVSYMRRRHIDGEPEGRLRKSLELDTIAESIR
ncbi:hypothetical protein ANN_22762 [Periplaneta americana]|uniref:Endonuclease-reverse transcriptase n=1 Tax=Periplaneta americana TaxID=6978 RepID=A0ABQ8SJ84_PERAM|nr:hypothetical protein ANN_22762 [Periplaneta americana]